MKKKHDVLKVIYSLIFILFLIELPARAKPTLRVGAIPDQNPEQLNRLYGLLASELSRELNVNVRYIPISNYPAAVSAFRTGSLDLVWFGGLTGVQARLQTPGARVLAQREIDAQFHSVFIANNASGLPEIKSKDDLKLLRGKRFTFGSESSTSGRLMPQYFLLQAGVKPEDFAGGRTGFSGSHDATLALVQSGSYQVGAMNEQVWDSNLKRGRVNPQKVKVIWRTPAYADYHWLVQPDLDQRFSPGFTNQLQLAILGLNKNSKEQKKILDLFGANSFIKAAPEQYKPIEEIGRKLGKIN